METSRVDQLYHIFNSQAFSLFIALIFASAAFGGKLNMNAAAICLALAWLVGCVGIYKFDVITDWYLMLAIWLALGSILALLASQLLPSIPIIGRSETTATQQTAKPQTHSSRKERQNSAEHFAETVHSLEQLLDTLKNYRGDQAHILVAYVNIKHRPLADKIATIFTQAEWKTDFRDRPLDTHLPLSTEGTVIYGCNSKLVSTIFNALRVAGLSEIEAKIEEPDSERNSPKWDREQHSLRVRIGYQ